MQMTVTCQYFSIICCNCCVTQVRLAHAATATRLAETARRFLEMAQRQRQTEELPQGQILLEHVRNRDGVEDTKIRMRSHTSNA